MSQNKCDSCTKSFATCNGKPKFKSPEDDKVISCKAYVQKDVEVTKAQREGLTKLCDAINENLAKSGITEVVAVPVTTLIIADKLREEHAEMKARLESLDK